MITGKEALIEALNKIGTEPSIEQSKNLSKSRLNTTALHLRRASLNEKSLNILIEAFKTLNSTNDFKISSLSLSYNNEINEEGLLFLVKHMPKGLTELGLVGCGLTDLVGEKILDWLKINAGELNLLCIEDNDLSEDLKMKFRAHAKTINNLYLEL